MGFSFKRAFKKAFKAPSRLIRGFSKEASRAKARLQKEAERVVKDVKPFAPLIAGIALGPLAGEIVAAGLGQESPAGFLTGLLGGGPAPAPAFQPAPRTTPGIQRLASKRLAGLRANVALGTIAGQATPIGTGDPRFTRGAIIGATTGQRGVTRIGGSPDVGLNVEQIDQLEAFVRQQTAIAVANDRAQRQGRGAGFGFGFGF